MSMNALFEPSHASDAPPNRQQVLYRRWRPQTFAQMAGQQHITQALKNAIRSGRLGQAYLLVGPKGTGKTTTARIIAKAANCRAVEEGDPCDDCQQCGAINTGTHMDTVEIDAASNRGIDEIRDLRDSVRYLPSQGRRKVYIIDEVHMLTAAASNAFLKTLEEPPEHVMFVLCTTAPDSILPTITSRCQRLDFRRLSVDAVSQRLRHVAERETIPIDGEAIETIARNCGGSLRDAQNMLETLAVGADGPIGRPEAENMLGLANRERFLPTAIDLLDGRAEEVIGALTSAVEEGEDSGQIYTEIQNLLRHALLLALNAPRSSELTDATSDALEEAVRRVGPERAARAIDIWNAGEPKPHHPDGLGMEVAAAKLGLIKQTRGRQEEPVEERERAPDPPDRPRTDEPPPPPREFDDQVVDSRPIERARREWNRPRAGTRWERVIRSLERTRGRKFNIGALLNDCREDAVVHRAEQDRLIAGFRNPANLGRLRQELEAEPWLEEKINAAVAAQYGDGCTLEPRMAHEVRRADPNNNAIVRMATAVGARIVPNR